MKNSSSDFRIAGCIVLYHPDDQVLVNMDSVLNSVDTLYVIDNSEHPDRELTEQITSRAKVRYRSFPENIGVASALNVSARLALEGGFDFLLTMDQDSRAEPEMVREMLAFFNVRKGHDIGMLAPNHVTRAQPFEAKPSSFQEICFSMTSGCLLNLDAYKNCGPFMDKLFIDYVDIEYGLRLKTNGYRIVKANNAVLHHGLGCIKKYCIPGVKSTFSTNHSALRLYYITRNMFSVHDMYRESFPGIVKEDRRYYRKRIAKIIFFERNKIAKLKMCRKGYKDYKAGIFGKIQLH